MSTPQYPQNQPQYPHGQPQYAQPQTQYVQSPLPQTRWSEPTRRYATGRLSYDARYITSLALVLFGGYELYLTQGSSLYSMLGGYGGGVELAWVVYLVFQVVVALAAVGIGFAIAPGSSVRRTVAAAIAVFVPIIAIVLGVLRLSPVSGTLFRGSSIFLSITLANLPFMVILAVSAAWLLVRERPGLAYLVLLATVVIAVLPYLMNLAGISSGVLQIVLGPVSVIITFGMIWLARAIAPIGAAG